MKVTTAYGYDTCGISRWLLLLLDVINLE